MGLSYHFSMSAAGQKTAGELRAFLESVELAAKEMGFSPTMVLDAVFDSEERRQFGKRITRGFVLEDEKLKGVELKDGQVWQHDPGAGYCRVIPERGLVLVVTDEKQCESVFGFFKYPTSLLASDGAELFRGTLPDKWVFSDFVDSSDSRYRAIVQEFANAGYLEFEKDEFVGCRLPSLRVITDSKE